MKNQVSLFRSIRMKLACTALLLVIPALLAMYILDLPMAEFAVGFVSLIAAWLGGEFFVRRQVKAMSDTAAKIADGDLNARVGLPASSDELGHLAQLIDRMVESLQLRVYEDEKLAVFAQLNPYPAMEFNAEGELTYFNEAAWKLAQLAQKEHPRQILPETSKGIARDCLGSNEGRTIETMIKKRTFSWSFHPITARRVVHCYVEDVTERLNLEEQLRQSQKMESVGQLAAGVAHDFNNILTVIQGNSSLLLSKGNLSPKATEKVQTIFFAAERAASLTRQLLMFSRKNMIQLKPLDLREVVGNMNKMLSRLLGETISLQFDCPIELPFIQGDGGMIEQVVMNLSVNARDAMPEGGKLSVRLDAMNVDAAYAETHPEARTGRFVRLRVVDTGCGMDSVTLTHLFEPFFTTKEIGKGTGLGLATVYGIVKQHEGWIEARSESGKGSTFDVYFPVSESVVENVEVERPSPVVGGEETIMIVEDEQTLREMARDILHDLGYNIIEAPDGKAALALWKTEMTRVNLLLTDMVMPEGISGIDLAERLLDDRPDLKIIFTSGYNSNELNAELLTRSQTRFLQKPYTHATLARAVRECLDQNVPAGGTTA